MSEREQFTHLHLHSNHSVNDAMIEADALGKRLKELGMSKVAITDHGVMYNTPKMYKQLKYHGIDMIVGSEVYVAPRSKQMKQSKVDDANYHLVLLCENQEGYENLLQIVSKASLDGMYYKPRTDKHFLRSHSKGLIAISACLGGELLKTLVNEGYDKAKEVALMYEDIFGKGNYFIEIQDHGMELQWKTNKDLIKIARETGIGLVATNDCHYIYQENAKAHDVLMAIQAGVPVTSDKRKKYPTDQFYVKSAEEMWEIFKHVPDALENTMKIADRCNFKYEFGVNKLPPFEVPSDYKGTNLDFLRDRIYEGLEWRYGSPLSQEVIDRAEYEIQVVDNMGYVNYFLITWDFFRFCREGTENYGDPKRDDWDEILTGPGRGSGAGSIMLYSLGITHIDPIKYNLLFERFLDPSRISMPDIDSDFEYERRGEVIDYTVRKYGRDCVSQIITFNTLAAKASIRAVGRALDYPLGDYDKWAKLIPFEPGIKIKKALEKVPELNNIYNQDPRAKKLIDIAMDLEGLPTSVGTNACGVLITDKQGVEKHTPMWQNKAAIVSTFDKDILEDVGLLKMDFLGLRTLGVMKETVVNVYKNHGVKIDIDELYKIPTLEPLKLVREGRTHGIFQLESPGMTSFMKELKPETIEDIIAGISLYRPGPMAEIPNFINNKRNPKNIKYPLEGMSEILDETYGVLTYQEQCMRMVVSLSGYDKSDSDGFRKVIAKKVKSLVPLHRKWFIDGRKKHDLDAKGKIVEYPHEIPGGVALGHSREELEKIFDKMEDFASYCFNKSHAAAYAFVGYITMYLAYYYPVEFFAAILNSVRGENSKVLRYVNYCRSIGIEIVAPDINKSSESFTPSKDGKIFASMVTKGGGFDVVKSIAKERETNGDYTDMVDFFIRTKDFINRATFEGLAAVGAFKGLGVKSSQCLAALDDIFDGALKKTKDAEKRAIANTKRKVPFNFRERFIEKISDNVIPDIEEFPDEIRFNLEKEYLGIYISGHPLYKYSYTIKTKSNFEIQELEYDINEETGAIELLSDIRDRHPVRFVALASSIEKKVSKAGNEIALMQLEDLTGSTKAMLWPDPLRRLKDILKDDKIYFIQGFVSLSDDNPPIVIIEDMQEAERMVQDRLIIELDDKYQIKELYDEIKSDRLNQGPNPVYVKYNETSLLLGKDYWVNINKFTTKFKHKIINY